MDGQRKILIVEDDPFIAMDIEGAFRKAGYQIVGPASDVRSALKLIDDDIPSCASLDYNLGAETSIPVAEHLRKKGIRFVFVTGRSADLVDEFDVPGSQVLHKPVDPRTIVTALAV